MTLYTPAFPRLPLPPPGAASLVRPGHRLAVWTGPGAYGASLAWMGAMEPSQDAPGVFPWGPPGTRPPCSGTDIQALLDAEWPRSEDPYAAWEPRVPGPPGLVEPLLDHLLADRGKTRVFLYPETGLDEVACAGIGELLVGRALAGWATSVETQSEVLVRRALAWRAYRPELKTALLIAYVPAEGSPVDVSLLDPVQWPLGLFREALEVVAFYRRGIRGRQAREAALARRVVPAPAEGNLPGNPLTVGLPSDPFTGAIRLCDNEGMVSTAPIPGEKGRAAPRQTYLVRHNLVQASCGLPLYLGSPFPCTGHLHAGPHHLRCTSPAHARDVSAPVLPVPSPGHFAENGKKDT